jgi:hypothetical protein
MYSQMMPDLYREVLVGSACQDGRLRPCDIRAQHADILLTNAILHQYIPILYVDVLCCRSTICAMSAG